MPAVEEIIREAGSKGIAIGSLLTASKLKRDVLDTELKRLRIGLQIAGPFKYRSTDYYYASGHEPGGDATSVLIEAQIQNLGKKLISKTQVEEKTKQPFKKFFADGVRVLVGKGRAVEVKGGKSSYLLHIDAVLQLFPTLLPPASVDRDEPSTTPFGKQVLAAYQSLKSEQGGLSAVSIGKLINRLGCSKQALHEFLLEKSQQRQADLHPTTSLDLTQDDRDGALTVPGKAEPAITVTFTG